MFQVKKPTIHVDVTEHMFSTILKILFAYFRPSIEYKEGILMEGRLLRSLKEGTSCTFRLVYAKTDLANGEVKRYPIQVHVASWEKYGLPLKRGEPPSLTVLSLAEGNHDDVVLTNLSHRANRRIWWEVLTKFGGVYELPTHLPYVEMDAFKATMSTLHDASTWLTPAQNFDRRVDYYEWLQDACIWGPETIGEDARELYNLYLTMVAMPAF